MLLHQLTIPLSAPLKRRPPHKSDPAVKRLESLTRILLAQLGGDSQAAAARRERLSVQTAWRYRRAFVSEGLKGLVPGKSPGRPRTRARKPAKRRFVTYQLHLTRRS